MVVSASFRCVIVPSYAPSTTTILGSMVSSYPAGTTRFSLVAYSLLVTYFHHKPSFNSYTRSHLLFCQPREYDAQPVLFLDVTQNMRRSRLIPVASVHICQHTVDPTRHADFCRIRN